MALLFWAGDALSPERTGPSAALAVLRDKAPMSQPQQGFVEIHFADINQDFLPRYKNSLIPALQM